jgi:hypothetical protein
MKPAPAQLILLLLCQVPWLANSAETAEALSSAVSVEIEPREAKLGEPVQATIRVRGKPGVSYELPEGIDLDPFVELGRSRRREGDQEVFTLKLAVYDQVGEVTLPAFLLKPETSDPQHGEGGEPHRGGVADPLPVPEAKITIQSIIAGLEKPEPRDIAGPVPVWVRDYRPLVFLGLVLLWVLSAWILRRSRFAGRSLQRLADLPPPRFAHQIAYDKLHRIVEDDLLRKGKFREYFIRVSETVREYLGNRYSFFAMDLTSRELLEELRDRPTPGLEHSRLKLLLDNADLVKFARLQPTDEMSSGAIDSAYTLVNATRKVPAEQEAE